MTLYVLVPDGYRRFVRVALACLFVLGLPSAIMGHPWQIVEEVGDALWFVVLSPRFCRREWRAAA